MKKYAVIGSDVTQSLSPKIFKYLFKYYGMDHDYIFRNVSEESLEKFVESEMSSFAGFNVTTPHKKKIMKYINIDDDSAKTANAVNVVKNIDEKFFGYNTDIYGVQKSLNLFEKKKFQKAVLIGNGGVTRAVLQALENDFDISSKIIITNYAEEIPNVIYVSYDNSMKHVQDADLVVNCSLYRDNMIFNPRDFSSECVFFDVNYLPSKFKEKFGHSRYFLDGKMMLLFQALKTFEIWFGLLPDLNKIGISWYHD